jgi:hypothetical protein
LVANYSYIAEILLFWSTGLLKDLVDTLHAMVLEMTSEAWFFRLWGVEA